jgi:isopentenyl diphosphate isomerase/L-lactate dehydrogenase-like FMN-dependent dehydrogenase
MCPTEKRWRDGISRRKALQGLAGFLAASPLLGQQDPFRDHSRVPGLDELLTTFDFEAVAFAKLPGQTYQFTAHGTESEYTLRRNREAFDWVKLVPRAVVDVSSIDASTEVLGTRMKFPLMLAPSSGHGALHPEGEVATHRGASAASDTPMILSSGASTRADDVSKAGSGPMWSQIYGREKIEDNLPLIEGVQEAGFKAIVLTVDQTAAYYERVQHLQHLSGRGNRGGRPARGRSAAAEGDEASNPYHIRFDRLWYNWPFIEKIRPYIKVPFLAKGILTAEDARLCVEQGLDGIIVSNHGGRSMDYGTSTLEVLPEIVDAVGGRIPVLIDSGFRRGADILKALALGAKAVCVGRVPRWGLASFGDAGVRRVLEIMQGELTLAMAHTGRPNLASIDRTLVRTHFPWA